MDPKSLANLDPKLRETYERVMGTTTPPSDGASEPSPFATTTTTPVAADTAPPVTDTAAVTAENAIPEATPGESSTVATTPDTAFSTPQPAAETPPQQEEVPTVATPASYMSVGNAPAEPQAENPYASAAPFPSPAEVAQSHEVSPVLRILYIVGAVIFFVAYTFFWMRIFNLSFPSF